MKSKYSIVLGEEYFKTNKQILKTWMLERNLPHLWVSIGRANFVDYLIFFDTEEDFLAFKLTFKEKYQDDLLF